MTGRGGEGLFAATLFPAQSGSAFFVNYDYPFAILLLGGIDFAPPGVLGGGGAAAAETGTVTEGGYILGRRQDTGRMAYEPANGAHEEIPSAEKVRNHQPSWRSNKQKKTNITEEDERQTLLFR